MNIAIIDDDKELLKVLKFSLDRQHTISTYENVTGINQNFLNSIDLLISDYDFGTQNLKTLLNEYKSRPPIFVITGKATKEIAIDLLNADVDYLIEKPIDINFLQKKINSLVVKSSNICEQFLNQFGYLFDSEIKSLRKNQYFCKLTPIEIKILTLLIESKNKEILRTDLENKVWPNTVISKNCLDTHVLNIKKKIPELKNLIRSNYGSGYVLLAQ